MKRISCVQGYQKTFSHTIFGFTKLNYNSEIPSIEKPIRNSGTEKIISKSITNAGKNLIDVRQPLLLSFGLDKPPWHNVFEHFKNWTPQENV